MKKVLITGANSYIGTSVDALLKNSNDSYQTTTIDMTNDEWKHMDFSVYDVVFHVAGIAHDTKKIKDTQMYFRVNRDLTVDVAKKAKSERVKQFIFMSSMLVYNGVKARMITKTTEPKVKGCYGESKLQADLKLQEMDDSEFKVAIVRPPMIFGKGSKGNFPRLIKLSDELFFFPVINNCRSMLYIENLTEFIRLLIDSEKSGIFFPQNPNYFCTTDIVRTAAQLNCKKLWFTKLLNPAVYIVKPFIGAVNKLFGDLVYDRSMSDTFDWKYIVADNQTALERTIRK